MEIRQATKKDIKEVGKIMLEVFTKAPFNEKTSFDAVQKSLKFYFNIGKSFVAIEGKEIIGAIIFKIEQYWEGSVIIIEDLAVKKKFEKQGIDHMLIKEVEAYAKKNKIKSVSFDTNKKSFSIKFYQKQGYKISKNRVSMSKKIK
jgi:predicted N-acetyltransferase YhbS